MPNVAEQDRTTVPCPRCGESIHLDAGYIESLRHDEPPCEMFISLAPEDFVLFVAREHFRLATGGHSHGD